MSLKGNLSSVNLTEIFQMLSLSGREGTLFIYEGPRKRAICFTKDGVSIRTRERNENFLIGKILVRIGKLDEDQLLQAVEARRTSQSLIGDLLVEMGFCEREDVEYAFRLQSEEEIQDLFLYRSDAQFEYVDEFFPESEFPFVNLNVNALLIEIARRTDEWEYIRRTIRGPREIYHFTGTEGQIDAELLAECFSHRVDPYIDGSHSVREVIEHSYVNKFEVCKLLAGYLDAGVIELVPQESIRQNAATALRMGDAETAIRHYEYLMSSGEFPLEVMAEAADAHEANRDYDEAATLLRRLAEELVRAGNEIGAVEALHRIANYSRPQPEALRYLLDLVFASPKAAVDFQANVIEAGKTLVAYHLQQEQHHEATSLLERLVKHFGDEIAFAVSLVNVYYDAGMTDKAVSECERLAAGYMKRRRQAQAVSLYKKLLVMDPERVDIRKRIRKITNDGRRKSSPGAFSRVAVTLAVMLLLAGVALVVLRTESGNGAEASGALDGETRAKLRAAAAQQLSLAEEHKGQVVEIVGKLVDMVREAPVDHRDELLVLLRDFDKHSGRFRDRAQKVDEIARTLLEQEVGVEEDRARAREILAHCQEFESRVDSATRAWTTKSHTSADILFTQALGDYERGEHRRALRGLELAQNLADQKNWERASEVEGYVRDLRGTIHGVEAKIRSGKVKEKNSDWVGARQVYLKLLEDYRKSDLVREIRLPVEILTVPSGASIKVDETAALARAPVLVRLDPFRENVVVAELDGFETHTERLGPYGGGTDASAYRLHWVLRKAATWTHEFGDVIEADPVAFGNRLVVAGRNGKWRVLDAKTGKTIRTHRIGKFDGVSASLASDGKRAVLPTIEGKLVLVDGQDGKARTLSFKRKTRFEAAPTIADGTLYIVDHEGIAMAFDLETNEVVWSVTSLPAVRTRPVVLDDKHLVIVSLTGDVAVLRRTDGEAVHRFTLEGGTFRCAPTKIGSDLIFTSESGWMGRIDPLTGEEHWKASWPINLRRSPMVIGAAVFLSPADRELLVVDALTGKVSYRVSGSAIAAQKAARPDNRIFFARDRELSAYAPSSDGYVLAWVFEAKAEIVVGPILRDDAVYLGDSDGNLYRLEANG